MLTRCVLIAQPLPQVDRIIAHRVRNGRPVYPVKWQGLGYSEATWEDGERDLADDQVGPGPCQMAWLPSCTSVSLCAVLPLWHAHTRCPASLAPRQAHIERYERFSVPPSEEEQQQRQEQEGQELDTAWGKGAVLLLVLQPAAHRAAHLEVLSVCRISTSCLLASRFICPAFWDTAAECTRPQSFALPALPAVPDFCNGRQLRDYQRVSLDWMVSNWAVRRNCILGDEVG